MKKKYYHVTAIGGRYRDHDERPRDFTYVIDCDPLEDRRRNLNSTQPGIDFDFYYFIYTREIDKATYDHWRMIL